MDKAVDYLNTAVCAVLAVSALAMMVFGVALIAVAVIDPVTYLG